MSRIRPKLTYANVVATLALFIALGIGSAWAGTHLGKDSVKSKQIRAGAVKNSELADGAVTRPKIANDAVDGSKIADQGVASADLADGVLTSPKIADGAITGPKLADSAVNGSKIADQSVGSADIDPAVITSLKQGCPANMTKLGNVICIDTTSRGSGDYSTALTTCAAANLRLPSPGEAYLALLAHVGGTTAQIWTDVTTGAGNNAGVTSATWVDENFNSLRSSTTATSLNSIFCAVPPSNG